MNCPQCQGEDCIQIEIRLKESDSVEFFSCRRCEHKWWEHDGGTIALDEVLTLASEKEQADREHAHREHADREQK